MGRLPGWSEYTEEAVGREAFEYARQLVDSRPWMAASNAEAAISHLREIDEDVRLGPSTRLHRPGRRGRASLPPPHPGSLVQFGWGSKQRRIQAAEIDSTSAVAESIGQDKDPTKRLLPPPACPYRWASRSKRWTRPGPWPRRSACPWSSLPGRQPGQGRHRQHHRPRPARRGLQERRRRWHRDGRALPARAGFPPAGGGRPALAAARREPPQVLGDGEHTVRELVDMVNQDPRRGEGHATTLTKIRLDDIAVPPWRPGLTPDRCPKRPARHPATTPTCPPAAPPPT